MTLSRVEADGPPDLTLLPAHIHGSRADGDSMSILAVADHFTFGLVGCIGALGVAPLLWLMSRIELDHLGEAGESAKRALVFAGYAVFGSFIVIAIGEFVAAQAGMGATSAWVIFVVTSLLPAPFFAVMVAKLSKLPRPTQPTLE